MYHSQTRVKRLYDTHTNSECITHKYERSDSFTHTNSDCITHINSECITHTRSGSIIFTRSICIHKKLMLTHTRNLCIMHKQKANVTFALVLVRRFMCEFFTVKVAVIFCIYLCVLFCVSLVRATPQCVSLCRGWAMEARSSGNDCVLMARSLKRNTQCFHSSRKRRSESGLDHLFL